MELKIMRVERVHGELRGQVSNRAGVRVFVPKRLREDEDGEATIQQGDFVVVNNVSYANSAAPGDPEGTFTGPGFDRDEVTFAGTYNECYEAVNEAAILGAKNEKLDKQIIAALDTTPKAAKRSIAVSNEPAL